MYLIYNICASRMQMANNGTVELEYSWQVMMDTSVKTQSFNPGGNF